MKQYYIYFLLLFAALLNSPQSKAQTTDNLTFENKKFQHFCYLHRNDSIDHYHKKLIEKWQKKQDNDALFAQYWAWFSYILEYRIVSPATVQQFVTEQKKIFALQPSATIQGGLLAYTILAACSNNQSDSIPYYLEKLIKISDAKAACSMAYTWLIDDALGRNNLVAARQYLQAQTSFAKASPSSMTIGKRALAYQHLGQLEEALKNYKRQLTALLKESILDSLPISHSYLNIANIYSQLNSSSQAKTHYNKALEIASKQSKNNYLRASIHYHFSQYWKQQNQAQKVKENIGHALNLLEQLPDSYCSPKEALLYFQLLLAKAELITDVDSLHTLKHPLLQKRSSQIYSYDNSFFKKT